MNINDLTIEYFYTTKSGSTGVSNRAPDIQRAWADAYGDSETPDELDISSSAPYTDILITGYTYKQPEKPTVAQLYSLATGAELKNRVKDLIGAEYKVVLSVMLVRKKDTPYDILELAKLPGSRWI